MHSVLEPLTQFLFAYGYPALFGLLVLGIVGLPVPDETLLTFCGYLIFRGRLNPAFTILTGFLGSACGISISFWLGSHYGDKLVKRFGKYIRLSHERISKTEQEFARFGPALLTIGYFIPGVRHFTAVIAGMSGLSCGKFAFYAYIGAAFWVSTFLMLGYLVGDGWQHSSEIVHRYVLAGAYSLAGAFTVVWLLRSWRKSRG